MLNGGAPERGRVVVDVKYQNDVAALAVVISGFEAAKIRLDKMLAEAKAEIEKGISNGWYTKEQVMGHLATVCNISTEVSSEILADVGNAAGSSGLQEE